MKRTMASITCLVLTMVFVHQASAQMIYPGEELVYRVSYLNITLGTIKCVVEPYITYNGVRNAKVKVYIDTHPNIPFVSIHSIYESWLDEGGTFSNKFNANTKIDDDNWEFDQYLMDYKARTLTLEKYKQKVKVETKTMEIRKRFNDGSSILYAARALLYAKKTYKIPTVIMGDTVNTVINFQAKQETVEIDAVPYPIKTAYLNGDANWTGVYGLSGRFEGWFSDDEARIPIKAKMKLYVGSAVLELQSWKRGSWQPPKAG
ncbi:MAG: DUF3108 domain-containing protein [Ignavibacteria bacterium]|nr:DUF3108 domain-containing protein [Ignavibacteria bacterium]